MTKDTFAKLTVMCLSCKKKFTIPDNESDQKDLELKIQN